jgi:4-amino-4-deoxychorismate lyase
MSAVDGRIRHFGLHLERLEEGCRRLRIPMPAAEQLEHDCSRVLEGLGAATVKLIVTRGPGPGTGRLRNPRVSRVSWPRRHA